jgi:acetyl coenzyme A synthetase (ADP forming)-like protein
MTSEASIPAGLAGLEPVAFRDGTPAWLRAARPADERAVEDLFGRASRQSLFMRFFTPLKRVDPALIKRLVHSDGIDSAAYVITRGVGDQEAVLAIANYNRLSSGTAADAAFFVDDAYQGEGLGTLLLERLARHAAATGIGSLHADVLAVNERMLGVFRDSGLVTGSQIRGDTIVLQLSTHPSDLAVESAEERERVATVASLTAVLRPNAVAVIGASRDPKAIGRLAFDSLLGSGFAGTVYPVNRSAAAINSVRAYASILDVPDTVDLAIIAVPAEQMLALISDCATRGVRGLIILSAGFAETGPEGRALQDQLLVRVRAEGMRMVGPNCIGVINTAPDVCMNASFSPSFPPHGNIAIASQSGAIGAAVLDAAGDYELGISTFISIGNRADVSGNDLLQYWERDSDTKVILLYLESFGNARKFARIARRVSRQKPILAVTGGRTAAGSRAAGSHTAAMASDERAVKALLRQAGIIRADGLEELFHVAALLSHQPLPSGRRVAIVTNAGGPGILCADACETQGLTLARFSEQTLETLKELLPAAAARANPVDMIASASAEQFAATTRLVLEDGDVDAVVVIHTPIGAVGASEVAAAVEQAVKSAREAGIANKPVLACATSGREEWLQAAARASVESRESLPSYRFPETAARALALAVEYAEWRRRPFVQPTRPSDIGPLAVRSLLEQFLATGPDRWLSAIECAQLLKSVGIPVVETRWTRTENETLAAAAEIGYPVAIKIDSARYIHKTEAGGVLLGLETQEAVLRACQDLDRRLGDGLQGFVVQKMVDGVAEMLIGSTADPNFGPLVALGTGGVSAEALDDIAFRLAPLCEDDARDMIASIRGRRFLGGFRGRPRADLTALVDLLLRVSWLADTHLAISELDLNPVAVLAEGSGAVAVDARIRIQAAHPE